MMQVKVKMEKIDLCRICLNENVHRVIENTQLQQVYEKLTAIPLQTSDVSSLAVCYICYAQLNQARRLMLRCLKAEEILTQMLIDKRNNGEEEDRKSMLIERLKLSSSLSISVTEHNNIESGVEVPVIKQEIIYDQDLDTENICASEFGNVEASISELHKETNTYYNNTISSSTNVYGNLLNNNQRQYNIISETQKHKETQTDFDENAKETSVKHYNCNVCQKSFEDNCNLEIHKRIHTIVKPYTCNVCQKSFNDKSNLKIHTKIHINQPVICDEFKNDSNDNCNLKIHNKIDKLYTCNVCQKSFNDKNNLKIHTKIHTNDQPMICDETENNNEQNSSSDNCNLKVYDNTEKPYTCNVCQKSFKNQSNLIKHNRIHTGEKPYACDVCSRSFAQKNDLKTHAITHTGDRPYTCKVCQKGFTRKSNLNEHSKIHDKRYTCNLCDKKFTNSYYIQRHSRIHTGENLHTCNICQKGFIQKSDLKKHVRIHTGEKPYTCNVCQRSFNVKGHLLRHIRLHT